MKISQIIWLQRVVEKIEKKHNLRWEEVEEVFANRPQYRFLEFGDIEGEDVYGAYGRSDSGRYVTVIFILKSGGRALIVTSRDMDRKERKKYGK
jgi:uncharacterized DUF497 family protein